LDTHKPKLLLHACCGPCTTSPYKELHPHYKISVYFYNPNIHPVTEYKRRLKDLRELADKWNFDLILGSYDTKRWFQVIKGLEDCKEGGQRCVECYRLRLQKTAETAKGKGFDLFATTLTVSPLKNAEVINRIGINIQEHLGIDYMESNFKKKDGFKKSCKISRQEGMYRQNYCGCIYSRRESSND